MWIMQSQAVRRMLLANAVHGKRYTRSSSSRAGRTVLGTTAGSTILFVAGSLLLWPLSDLFLGPKLIEWGLSSASRRRGREEQRDDALNNPGRSPSQFPSFTIACQAQSEEIRQKHAAAQRAVIYISLRDATTTHDLFMAISSGLWSRTNLGLLGVVVQSTGTWWCLLLDIVMGSSNPAHLRKLNVSVMLNQAERALEIYASRHDSRPLIILDHTDQPARYLMSGAGGSSTDESQAIRAMLLKLLAWSTAVCHDKGLADVCLFVSAPPRGSLLPVSRPWRSLVFGLDKSGSPDLEAVLHRYVLAG